MAIDALQEKIRKTKNPTMVEFTAAKDRLPPHLLQEEPSVAAACGRFCRELLDGLKGQLGAVRFRFASFALLGPEGLAELQNVLETAGKNGYYVVLDAPELLSVQEAETAAEVLFGGGAWPCDAVVISAYLGSDVIRPFLPYCKGAGKDLFLLARTSNKSASELQDLLAGSRLVHGAVADLANRYGESYLGKYSYSQVGLVAGAGAADSTRNLRAKYNRLFLLLEGYDYSSANAKKCSLAFDKFGRGAVVCAGASITDAWQESASDGRDYVTQAVQAAERMKKNLTSYLTIV